jgi:hypothetical protein
MVVKEKENVVGGESEKALWTWRQDICRWRRKTAIDENGLVLYSRHTLLIHNLPFL